MLVPPAAVATSGSLAETVTPDSGSATWTIGGIQALLETATVTTADVPVRPLELVVWTASQCVPFGTSVVFQAKVYGIAVTGAPMGRPSTRNWTPVVSAVVAVKVTVPARVLPPAGDIRVMAGGGGRTGDIGLSHLAA